MASRFSLDPLLVLAATREEWAIRLAAFSVVEAERTEREQRWLRVFGYESRPR